jgi:hypothetical protein
MTSACMQKYVSEAKPYFLPGQVINCAEKERLKTKLLA